MRNNRRRPADATYGAPCIAVHSAFCGAPRRHDAQRLAVRQLVQQRCRLIEVQQRQQALHHPAGVGIGGGVCLVAFQLCQHVGRQLLRVARLTAGQRIVQGRRNLLDVGAELGRQPVLERSRAAAIVFGSLATICHGWLATAAAASLAARLLLLFPLSLPLLRHGVRCAEQQEFTVIFGLRCTKHRHPI